jgi:hypothetical protein
MLHVSKRKMCRLAYSLVWFISWCSWFKRISWGMWNLIYSQWHFTLRGKITNVHGTGWTGEDSQFITSNATKPQWDENLESKKYSLNVDYSLSYP